MKITSQPQVKLLLCLQREDYESDQLVIATSLQQPYAASDNRFLPPEPSCLLHSCSIG